MIDTERQIKNLTKIVKGRTVAILLPAPSIATLDKRILEFTSDICWTTVNDYWVLEDRILSQVGAQFEIVMRSAVECDVPNERDDMLLNRGSLLVTETVSFHRGLNDYIEKYGGQIFFFTADRSEEWQKHPDVDHPLHFFAQQSFAILLSILSIGMPERIIVFGGEGCVAEDPATYGAYGGYPQSDKRRLINDTHLLNATWPTVQRNTCNLYNLVYPTIINCTEKSYFTVFPKWDYDKVIEVING